jgi:bifunctional enzyme CysN/CysC
MVVWLGDRPFVAGRSYLLKQTTRTVPAELAALHHAVDVNTLGPRQATSLAMNEVGRVTLALHRPIAYDAYKNNRATGAFILIDRSSNGTVGAGMLQERRRAASETGMDRPRTRRGPPPARSAGPSARPGSASAA